jgi:3-hydroxyisobutyrate dehydrogenase
MNNLTVGFIGLGNIGKPMASHLRSGGFAAVYVYDVFPEAMKSLVDKGAIGAKSPAEMAATCDVIGLCVRNDADVESLIYGDSPAKDNGLFAKGKQGLIIAIHSTVKQTNIVKWAEEAKKYGVNLIDAPITGGADGAQNKKLVYMVGGDEMLVKKCEPVFMTSAEKVIRAGGIGCGIALKLCNNLMTYAQFIAIDEGSRLAEACGLDKNMLYEVGQLNGVISPQMHRFVSNRDAFKGKIPDKDFDSIFLPFALLGEKDLESALASAKDHGTSLPATENNVKIIRKVFLKEIK